MYETEIESSLAKAVASYAKDSCFQRFRYLIICRPYIFPSEMLTSVKFPSGARDVYIARSHFGRPAAPVRS